MRKLSFLEQADLLQYTISRLIEVCIDKEAHSFCIRLGERVVEILPSELEKYQYLSLEFINYLSKRLFGGATNER